MAKTRFSYVRDYELSDALLPNTFIVVRLDGKGFHRFSDHYGWDKPNDRRALELINAAAVRTMSSETLRQHAILGFGESDEYSFLLSAKSTLFNRRNSKIVTSFVSIFTASYVLLWPSYFPNTPLDPAIEGPSFDGRIVLYPSQKEVIDYFKWRQADTHINNLYNTAFWALVQQGNKTVREAHAELAGTVSSQKNDILFDRFGINYNNIDEMYRRGTILLWQADEGDAAKGFKAGKRVEMLHEDLLKDAWWSKRPTLL